MTVDARPPNRPSLVRFVEAVLPAGLTAEDIQDALWLARWIRDSAAVRAAGSAVGGADAFGRADEADESGADGGIDSTDERLPVYVPWPTGPTGPDAGPTAIRGDSDADGSAGPAAPRRWAEAVGGPSSVAPVSIPATSGFQMAEFARFSRRLRSRRVLDPAGPVDEPATVERAAETGIIWPVHERIRARRAAARVVVDTSVSMAPWGGLERDLVKGLRSSRSFRRVEAWSLALRAGKAVVDVRGGEASLKAGSRRLSGLADPSGDSIVLILTDGVSRLWYSGVGAAAAAALAAHNPTAILQPLPDRLWRRTALAPRMAIAGAVSARVDGFHLLRDVWRGPAPVVPVLSPSRVWLDAWAGLATGMLRSGRQALVGSPPPAPATAASSGVPPVSGEVAVRRFQTSASAGARELAAALSSAPLSLPVMQMVLDVCVHDPSPVYLAEVLTGGLMRQDPAGHDLGAPLSFHWLPGVREELHRQVGERQAREVSTALSAYLDRELGFGPQSRGFRAVMGRSWSSSGRSTDHPFAFILPSTARRVLERLPVRDSVLNPDDGPEAVARAARALASVEAARLSGWAEDIDAAIEDSRLAIGAADPADAPPGRLAVGLAGLLAERWRRTGALDDLEEAIMVVREYGHAVPADGPEQAYSRGLLADLLLERFRATETAEFLDDSIRVRRQAVEMLAPSTAERQVTLLAKALLEHHRLSGSWVSLYEATDLVNGLTSTTADEDVRLQADILLGQCLDTMSRSTRLEEDIAVADRQWLGLLDRLGSLGPEDAVAVRQALEDRVRFLESSGRWDRARELAAGLSGVLARLGVDWGRAAP